MLTPLTRIIIFVADVEQCARFYVEAFGFTVVPSEFGAAEWMELETGGCRLAFHKARGPDGSIDVATGGPMNPHKIVFHAGDVEAARSALLARGVVIGEIRKFGDLICCDGQDPEGHVFQIANS